MKGVKRPKAALACPRTMASSGRGRIILKDKPDLRIGDPRIHDLIAEIDEAIDAGDEPRVEELSERLRELDPHAGAGADT